MEERLLFATFTVTSNADPVAVLGTTLRQAIVLANTSPGPDVINFNIAGAPVIHPVVALPEVTGPTTFNGTTQPGYSGTPLVWIDGTATLPDVLTGNNDGLRILSGGSVVRALAVSGFDNPGPSGILPAGIRLAGTGSHRVENSYVGTSPTGSPASFTAGNFDGVVAESDANVITGSLVSNNTDSGVVISGDNNRLEASGVGTDASGTAPYPNNLAGVLVQDAAGARIGGPSAALRNVISGNSGDGVRFEGAGAGNVVSGNYIGLDAGGSEPLPNAGNGVFVSAGASASTDLLIGGTLAAARNVISANFGNGVDIDGVSGVRVLANYVGTDASGSAILSPSAADLGNFGSGVLVEGGSGATRVGAPGAGNVVGGNFGDGVRFDGAGTGNLVQANLVGTTATGNAAAPNFGNGITVTATAAGVLIGGATAAAGNVVSGNFGRGIQLSDGSTVEFNLVGLGADGTTQLGNADDGIYIDGSDNVIGTPSTGNSIAYNGRVGVTVAGAPLVPGNARNAIRGNNIFFNSSLGIDLADDGVTPNDPQDPDEGPNELQNYPVLTSVTLSGNTATLSGTLNSTPLSTFTLDFFASVIWDTSTFGEGQKYLSSTTVTTDASGNATFTAAGPGVPAGFNYFAVTATDAIGNTSEFSYDPTPGAAPAAAAPPQAATQPARKRTDTGLSIASSTDSPLA